jgi:hypothetical protein
MSPVSTCSLPVGKMAHVGAGAPIGAPSILSVSRPEPGGPLSSTVILP